MLDPSNRRDHRRRAAAMGVVDGGVECAGGAPGGDWAAGGKGWSPSTQQHPPPPTLRPTPCPCAAAEPSVAASLPPTASTAAPSQADTAITTAPESCTCAVAAVLSAAVSSPSPSDLTSDGSVTTAAISWAPMQREKC